MRRSLYLAIAATMTATLLGVAIGSASPNAAEMPKLVAACASCHGTKGEGNEARSAPALAGLDTAYLERQLTLFAEGKRGTHAADKFGSQMAVIAQSLKDEDIDMIVRHYAKLRSTTSHVTISGDAAKGKAAYQNCAACHGEEGRGNPETSVPALIGQPDWYIVQSLLTYKAGGKGYHADDATGQQMQQAAQMVASEKEAQDIAIYINSLSSN
jgi:cytochrome c oxidase subunit 2